MIRFACSNCSRLISIDEKHSGKKGKCPKCGGVMVVPESSTVIEFACGSCGHKIRVPERHGGKKGACPKCKNPVVVPSLKKAPAEGARTVTITCSMCEEEIKVPENSRGQAIECPHCGCYIEIPSEKIPIEKAKAPVQTRRDDEVADKKPEEPQRPKGEVAVEESAPVGERKLPWPIDILLYPTSIPGLGTVAGFAILPVVFLGLMRICCMGALVGWIIGKVVWLYVLWYFGECIRESAAGELRAPERPGDSVDWGDVVWSVLRFVACFLFFFGPQSLYVYRASSSAEVNPVLAWSLLTYGVLFYPMGILAVVMFESVRGLNPILIFRSIVGTFLPYCGVVALFYGLGVLFVIGIIGSLPGLVRLTGDSLLSAILFIVLMRAGFLWLLLVAGHLLGRFYWRYEEKLNWNA